MVYNMCVLSKKGGREVREEVRKCKTTSSRFRYEKRWSANREILLKLRSYNVADIVTVISNMDIKSLNRFSLERNYYTI